MQGFLPGYSWMNATRSYGLSFSIPLVLLFLQNNEGLKWSPSFGKELKNTFIGQLHFVVHPVEHWMHFFFLAVCINSILVVPHRMLHYQTEPMLIGLRTKLDGICIHFQMSQLPDDNWSFPEITVQLQTTHISSPEGDGRLRRRTLCYCMSIEHSALSMLQPKISRNSNPGLANPSPRMPCHF